MRSAWAQVSAQYKPTQSGKWVHKDQGSALIIEGVAPEKMFSGADVQKLMQSVIEAQAAGQEIVLIGKGDKSTLYGRRNVENAADIIKWAKDQGFEKTLPAHEMHVTVAHSSNEVDWPSQDDDAIVVKSPRDRAVMALGDEGAVTLKFASPSLARRHEELCKVHGCSWDYPEFIPHVTITYDAGDLDLSKVKPYEGSIELGPEIFEPIVDDWSDDVVEKQNVLKFDNKLGLLIGWAIVCKQDGVDYYDTQEDHIPEDAMLEASLDFMQESRTLKLMHKGDKIGDVVFAWPLTTEIAKAMGLKTKQTGLMVAVKPATKKILAAFENGEITGFSIGGSRIKDEDVEEDD